MCINLALSIVYLPVDIVLFTLIRAILIDLLQVVVDEVTKAGWLAAQAIYSQPLHALGKPL